MMVTLFSEPLSSVAYGFLALAIVSLWLSRRPWIWLSLSFIATSFAFKENRIQVPGLIAEVSLCLFCFIFYKKNLNSWLKGSLGGCIALLSIVLGMHKAPGFRNWMIFSEIRLSPDAIPLTAYLNFDKPLIGLFLIGWGYPSVLAFREWWLIARLIAPIFLAASVTLLGLSSIFSYVKVDLKWFEFSGFWLSMNLLFTCVTEEALFRGFMQEQLTRILPSCAGPSIGAWILASILFGLAHFKGGWTYVGLATVAGFFYGYAYIRTKRLEASILTHFAVNAIHFIGFTYPALKSSF